MTRTLTILLAGLALLASPRVALTQQGPSPLRTAIESVNQNFMTLLQKGDVAGLAALYTAEGEALPPNGEVVRGRDAIQQMWKGVLDAGIASAKLTTREVEGVGATAWEGGNYEMFAKDGKSLDRGKYIVIWKRSNGQWQIHRDMWNSSQPR